MTPFLPCRSPWIRPLGNSGSRAASKSGATSICDVAEFAHVVRSVWERSRNPLKWDVEQLGEVECGAFRYLASGGTGVD